MNSSFSYSYDAPPSPQYVTDESEDDQSMDTMEVVMVIPLNVTFAETHQLLEIPSRETYSMEEKRASWYKQEDYHEMKGQAFETIQWHRSGQLLPGNHITDHSMRGLEGRTTDGYDIVKNNRTRASYAVIDEQDRQDEIGISDSELLAGVYQPFSLPCKCLALARGLFDAQEVIKDIILSQDDSLSPEPSTAAAATTVAATTAVPTTCTVATTLPASYAMAPDHNLLLILLGNPTEDEQPRDMVMDSTFQSRCQEKGLNDTMSLDSMERTTAEA